MRVIHSNKKGVDTFIYIHIILKEEEKNYLSSDKCRIDDIL
jgi:hypothetical protein